jgi:hypothetical protein
MQYQKENVSLDQPYCSFDSWTKIIFKLQMDNKIIKKNIEKVLSWIGVIMIDQISGSIL